MAEEDTGYEDERFHQSLSSSFHCCICTNVFKEPVMCPQNEHIFCRSCITRHLMNSQRCPTCMQPLTVETLSPAPRGVRNLLSELKIRCDFYDRGCGRSPDLGELECHTKECGFAPVVCNGCKAEVNKQDLFHHETSVCEQRKVKCHSCVETRLDMATVRGEIATLKVSLSAVNKKLDRNESKGTKIIKTLETFERIQEDVAKMKKSLNEITASLTSLTREQNAEPFLFQKSMSSLPQFGNLPPQPPFNFR